MMMDEGYIKFTIREEEGPPPVMTRALQELNEVRTALFEKNLIGIMDNGIGFGNVSIRTGQTFVISGTATGHKKILDDFDYSEVVSFNIAENSVVCRGKVKASSESMSHGALYQANITVNAVVHIHSSALFNHMLSGPYCATARTTAYGTPAMAYELMEIARNDTAGKNIIVMAGHEDGVIAYGPTIREAYQLIADLYRNVFN